VIGGLAAAAIAADHRPQVQALDHRHHETAPDAAPAATRPPRAAAENRCHGRPGGSCSCKKGPGNWDSAQGPSDSNQAEAAR
jgi:hypothetical protein